MHFKRHNLSPEPRPLLALSILYGVSDCTPLQPKCALRLVQSMFQLASSALSCRVELCRSFRSFLAHPLRSRRLLRALYFWTTFCLWIALSQPSLLLLAIPSLGESLTSPLQPQPHALYQTLSPTLGVWLGTQVTFLVPLKAAVSLACHHFPPRPIHPSPDWLTSPVKIQPSLS